MFSIHVGNLRPHINVGCRNKMANADFEKLALAFFLIFGKMGMSSKSLEKSQN
jgi:hypothetical protein